MLDHYINDSLTAMITQTEIKIGAVNHPVTLRVSDRFTLMKKERSLGEPLRPRDVTNPGWQNA